MSRPNIPYLAGFLLSTILLCLSDTGRAQIAVRSALSDDREVTAGSTYEGTILVRNETQEEQEARVYQTDYAFHDDGSNEYGEPGSTSRSNASWIQVTPRKLVIPPGETTPVSYMVTVPDAPLSGTFWSMIMVEAVPRSSAESVLSTEDEKRYGVLQLLRYGIQIATHLPSEEDADLQIRATRLVNGPDGTAVLELSLENSGVRMVRPSVWLDLYDEEGASYGRKEGTRNRIYPSTSVRQRFDLGSVIPGTYKAMVLVDAGGDEVFGAEYSLEID